jgi:hypothetical protein
MKASQEKKETNQENMETHQQKTEVTIKAGQEEMRARIKTGLEEMKARARGINQENIEGMAKPYKWAPCIKSVHELMPGRAGLPMFYKEPLKVRYWRRDDRCGQNAATA